SAFWFARTQDLVANHLVSTSVDDFPEEAQAHADELAGRTMLCRALDIVAFECVARGYLVGSGWKEYQRDGSVCGIALPSGLQEASELPEPIFTPATKAESGHDVNVSFEHVAGEIGQDAAAGLRDLTLALYARGRDTARERGIILADTKFEFGRDAEGTLVLADEVLTPDSSRYWPADAWQPGTNPPSFDKQFVRDYAASTGWDKNPPAPELPEDIVVKTREKYVEAYERLTGESFDKWLERR
ncbi:MAG TPA: phosphoribosylaminoimidazolesuccinocarboxamide synthase, partial [Nitriliruptorales bacterium]